MEDLLKQLKERVPVQKEMCWEENIPEDLWNDYFEDYKEVTTNLNLDKHRHYEVSTTVVKLETGKYLGIHHLSTIYSDCSDASDIDWEISFFEMKEVQSVTYEEIKK